MNAALVSKLASAVKSTPKTVPMEAKIEDGTLWVGLHIPSIDGNAIKRAKDKEGQPTGSPFVTAMVDRHSLSALDKVRIGEDGDGNPICVRVTRLGVLNVYLGG